MVFDRIDENDRRTIIGHVDEFCEQCEYLCPIDAPIEGENPCEGCKMQEFVDSLNGRESLISSWMVEVVETRHIPITIAATSRQEAIRIAEELAKQGKLEDLRSSVECSFEAEKIDINPDAAIASIDDIR